MASRSFGFLPDSLTEDANKVAEYYLNLGYTVKSDHALPAAPAVPTLYAKRNNTQIVIPVVSKLDLELIANWGSYAKSTGKDFRICCVLNQRHLVDPTVKEFFRASGFGIVYVSEGRVCEELVAKDLAVAVNLPTIASLPKASQKHLGQAYEQFERSQWREGFEDACQSLENLARAYLVAEIKKGRVTQFIRKKGPVSAEISEVKRMTLGALIHAFQQIPNQTWLDAQIAQIIGKLNKDRIGIVHHKNKTSTEKRLRKNVGMHMWSIINGIRLLTK